LLSKMMRKDPAGDYCRDQRTEDRGQKTEDRFLLSGSSKKREASSQQQGTGNLNIDYQERLIDDYVESSTPINTGDL
jgi:hypothetical protein